MARWVTRHFMRLPVYNGVTPLSRNDLHANHITKERSIAIMKKYPFTRTISSQRVTVLAFDKVNAEAFNMSVTISPVITDPAKLEKAVAAKVDNDTTKLIEIVNTETTEKVYGLTLEAFMANAVELDPKTRKPLTANTTEA